MLVMARHPGDIFEIEGGIKIKIISVIGSEVRFGITAPPEICILGQEQYQGQDDRKEPDPIEKKTL